MNLTVRLKCLEKYELLVFSKLNVNKIWRAASLSLLLQHPFFMSVLAASFTAAYFVPLIFKCSFLACIEKLIQKTLCRMWCVCSFYSAFCFLLEISFFFSFLLFPPVCCCISASLNYIDLSCLKVTNSSVPHPTHHYTRQGTLSGNHNSLPTALCHI